MSDKSKIGTGEHGQMSMRVAGQEISIWKEYSYTSDFLSPTDNWRFVVGNETLTDELLNLLVPGNKVEFFIDGIKQSAGYIDIIDASGNRATGANTIVVEGRDTFAPVVDSQIDPLHKYPEKYPLDKLILDVLEPFNFKTIEIDNAANVEVKARLASDLLKPRKHRGNRPDLRRFPVPKKKPQHNDSFFNFLSRITQRYGLWMWPTVDGDGVVVSSPDYDQDPKYEIRRKRNGAANNIQSGGIRKDSTEQPTFISCTGDIPAVTHEHAKMRVVIDNPYVVGLGLGQSFAEYLSSDVGRGASPESIAATRNDAIKSSKELLLLETRDKQDEKFGHLQYSASQEKQTFNEFLVRTHKEVVAGSKWTEVIKVKPIVLNNVYASKVARPRFLRDGDSHTIEELRFFARRQLSLCIRKAYVGRYRMAGHKLNGNIVNVDTIIDIDDEQCRHKGPMWIQSVTFSMSRTQGATMDIVTLPINALQF